MKRHTSGLLTLLALLSLGGCAAVRFDNNSASSSSVVKQSEQTVQLIVQTADGKSEKTVTFEEGDSVLDILDANHDVTEDSGLVTAIDGLEQDIATNTYWLYKVNGVMAEKGAKDWQPKAGDIIEFYQEKFE